MKVDRIEGPTAHLSALGAERTASLALMAHDPVAPGDHVIVSLGYVQRKVTRAEAEESWTLFGEILDVLDGRER